MKTYIIDLDLTAAQLAKRRATKEELQRQARLLAVAKTADELRELLRKLRGQNK